MKENPQLFKSALSEIQRVTRNQPSNLSDLRHIVIFSINNPVYTGRKFNVHKTSRRRPGREGLGRTWEIMPSKLVCLRFKRLIMV